MAGTLQKHSRGGRTGYAVADVPRDLLIRLVECPELPLRMGPAETVKAGNSALVVRAQLPIGGRMVPVCYKRVRRKTWVKRLTQLVGPNRTLRTFRAGLRLTAAGVGTARPLAVIVPSRFDATVPTWLATEWLEGEDLAAFAARCRKLPPRDRTRRVGEAGSAVGALLGRMHAAGISHRDLKPQNLMVRCDLGAADAFVIDLDGVRISGAVSLPVRWKNLSRLAVGENGWCEFGPANRLRFLRAYLKASALDIGWKSAWREIAVATAARRHRRVA